MRHMKFSLFFVLQSFFLLLLGCVVASFPCMNALSTIWRCFFCFKNWSRKESVDAIIKFAKSETDQKQISWNSHRKQQKFNNKNPEGESTNQMENQNCYYLLSLSMHLVAQLNECAMCKQCGRADKLSKQCHDQSRLNQSQCLCVCIKSSPPNKMIRQH